MKKGMRMFDIVCRCRNNDMLGQAYAEIEDRTKTGACQLQGVDASWDGLSFSEATFYAIPVEVAAIKNDIEFVFRVSIYRSKNK